MLGTAGTRTCTVTLAALAASVACGATTGTEPTRDRSGLLEIEKRPKKVQDQLGFKGRADLGLDDTQEWPVALPGYLFHSTFRATDETPRPAPYIPAGVHEACFPAGKAL